MRSISHYLFQVREERKLMNRLLVVSRTRTDIDLPQCIRMYEFTIAPPELFCTDGTLHKEKEKAKIADELSKLQNEHQGDE